MEVKWGFTYEVDWPPGQMGGSGVIAPPNMLFSQTAAG